MSDGRTIMVTGQASTASDGQAQQTTAPLEVVATSVAQTAELLLDRMGQIENALFADVPVPAEVAPPIAPGIDGAVRSASADLESLRARMETLLARMRG